MSRLTDIADALTDALPTALAAVLAEQELSETQFARLWNPPADLTVRDALRVYVVPVGPDKSGEGFPAIRTDYRVEVFLVLKPSRLRDPESVDPVSAVFEALGDWVLGTALEIEELDSIRASETTLVDEERSLLLGQWHKNGIVCMGLVATYSEIE